MAQIRSRRSPTGKVAELKPKLRSRNRATTAVVQPVLDRCEEVAALFGSLSHPTRLKVLCSLMEGEKSVGELTEFCEISQPAMSQFLNRMKADGILKSRRESTQVLYEIREPRLVQLLAATRTIFLGHP